MTLTPDSNGSIPRTVANQLAELADRCEHASGPDHILDAEIATSALGWREIPSPEGEWRCFESPAGARANIQRKDGVAVFDAGPLLYFTASLDAAITLVPEGWDISAGRKNGRGHAYIHNRGSIFTGMGCRKNPHRRSEEILAATPALALCAAALRARTTQKGDE